MPIQSVNDFVVRFANVNGSGSASANELFARAVMRMGVPVSPRNIFPSNIQGLPTWYEVRITEAGHLGARGGVDLMVAMNPQTCDKDIASIEQGGYLFYDSTKPLPASRFRDDITVIGVPLTAICNREYIDPRQRQLFKNIIYVGALAALLDMDIGVIEKLIAEQFRTKDTLIEPNVHALHLGRDYVMMNLEHPIGLRMKKANAIGDRILIEGNSAVALGAVYGGSTVCAWYPITPSSSVAEAFQRHCSRYRADGNKKNRYAIIQAEDELASIGMVIGAGWNGARAFTATSGPGISLMQEFLGPCLFRRNSRRDRRRAARRPLDRHADAHPAMRSHLLRLCLARRHQACAAVPGGSGRSLRDDRAGVRSRRPAADADLPDDRSRHRHEPPPLPPAQVGRHARLRPRKDHDRRDARSRQGLRALSRCR